MNIGKEWLVKNGPGIVVALIIVDLFMNYERSNQGKYLNCVNESDV